MRKLLLFFSKKKAEIRKITNLYTEENEEIDVGILRNQGVSKFKKVFLLGAETNESFNVDCHIRFFIFPYFLFLSIARSWPSP